MEEDPSRLLDEKDSLVMHKMFQTLLFDFYWFVFLSDVGGQPLPISTNHPLSVHLKESLI